MNYDPEAVTPICGHFTPEELIARLEGCRLMSYQDDGGRWTVGYGCTGPEIGPNTVWTQAQADEELKSRLATRRAQLSGLIKAPLSPGQFTAVCSLVWNIGVSAFASSTILNRLNALDYSGAADAWTDPEHIFNRISVPEGDGTMRHVVSQALTTRREREAAIFLDATDQTPTPPRGTK